MIELVPMFIFGAGMVAIMWNAIGQTIGWKWLIAPFERVHFSRQIPQGRRSLGAVPDLRQARREYEAALHEEWNVAFQNAIRRRELTR